MIYLIISHIYLTFMHSFSSFCSKILRNVSFNSPVIVFTLAFNGDQEIRSNFFFIINTYLRSLEAISRACSGHPKGRLSFGSLSLWKILAMIIAEGLLNVASIIKNRPWFV